MPLYESDAFALRTYPYSDNHKVCVFFTRQAGILRAVAHGSRSLKSRYGVGLELFSHVHMKYREREGQELVQLTDCELLKSSFELASDPNVAALLGYWGELLIEFLPAHQPNDHVYRLTTASLTCLKSDLDASDALLRYFEFWILKLSGFLPDYQACVTCEKSFTSTESFSVARNGTPECTACSNLRGLVIDAKARQVLLRVLRQSPADFASKRLEADTATLLGELTYRLITTALERELKSFAVLQQMKRYEA